MGLYKVFNITTMPCRLIVIPSYTTNSVLLLFFFHNPNPIVSEAWFFVVHCLRLGVARILSRSIGDNPDFTDAID